MMLRTSGFSHATYALDRNSVILLINFIEKNPLNYREKGLDKKPYLIIEKLWENT